MKVKKRFSNKGTLLYLIFLRKEITVFSNVSYLNLSKTCDSRLLLYKKRCRLKNLKEIRPDALPKLAQNLTCV